MNKPFNPDNLMSNLSEDSVEKNRIQPWPFRSKFLEEKINKLGERKPLSLEDEEKLNTMIKDAIELFKNSELKWVIDGGLSISILEGKFMGMHRDLDIAIEKKDLEKIEKLIEGNGYGFFITPMLKEKVMERADYKKFGSADNSIRWIISIDGEGKIIQEKSLSFINVHIINRDPEGVPINENGNRLPEEWFDLIVKNFKGIDVNIAHSAKTAYYKIRSNRDYDLSDLKHLSKTGSLTLGDIDKIDTVLKQDSKLEDAGFYDSRKESLDKLREWIVE